MKQSTGSRPGLLFLYNHASTFIHNDLAVFKEIAVVRSYECGIRKSISGFLVTMAKELFFVLKNIGSSEMVYCWFADYHALLPALMAKLTRKPFYLVLGGYDVHNITELGYGSFNRSFRGFCARYAMKNATCNLPVAESLAIEARKRAGEIRIHVLPTGYDPNKLQLHGQKEENTVITAAITHEKQTCLVKGLDRFRELALAVPDFTFVVAGVGDEMKSWFEPKPDNLLILPVIDPEELYQWFGRSKFYAQLSRSEGMPNGLCEAMLMECIPIGMSVGGIPAVIEKNGLLLDEWNPEIAKQFLLAHKHDSETGKKARQGISERFHYKRRQKFLEDLVKVP